MLSSQSCIIYLSLHYKAVLARYICSPYFSVISNFYVLPISISIPLKKKLSFSSNLLFPLTHVIFFYCKVRTTYVCLCKEYVIFPSWKVIRLTRIVFYLLYQHDRLWSTVCTQWFPVLQYDCYLLLVQWYFQQKDWLNTLETANVKNEWYYTGLFLIQKYALTGLWLLCNSTQFSAIYSVTLWNLLSVLFCMDVKLGISPW